MSPLKFCFESGQTTPSDRLPRQYKKRNKDAPTVKHTALSKGIPSKDRTNCSVASPLAVENSPEPEFNIILEDPTVPKGQRKFVAYNPPAKQTWVAPPVEGKQAPATISSFSIASAAEGENITPPQAVDSMRTPTNEPVSFPRQRTPSSGAQRTQRIHYHHYHNHYHHQHHRHIQDHPQDHHHHHIHHHGHYHHHHHRHQPHHDHHIPTAAPSFRQRVAPTHAGACGARPQSADRSREVPVPAHRPDALASAFRACLQSAARLISPPRLPDGVRVIARPGEWQLETDLPAIATAAAESSTGSGADSGVGADSGAASSAPSEHRPTIVQVLEAVPPPTRSTEREPVIAQPEVQAAVAPPTHSTPPKHSTHAAPVIQSAVQAAAPTPPPPMPATPVIQPAAPLPQRTFWNTVL